MSLNMYHEERKTFIDKINKNSLCGYKNLKSMSIQVLIYEAKQRSH
jgi:hypothetical protein